MATNMADREFSLGDIVEWTSQSAGIKKTKRGKVIEVVPAKADPTKAPTGSGMRRNHISYVISAKGVFPDGSLDTRARRYWPLVKYLRLVKAAE